MKRTSVRVKRAGGIIVVAVLAAGMTCAAQDRPPEASGAGVGQDRPPVVSRDTMAAGPEQPRQQADGARRGLPVETYAVEPGTKFLVRLDEELGTKGTQQNAKFKVKTLEPLEAGSGIYLPAGAEIRGHISHVEPAGVAGRAKLWLTFDEIHTKFGDLPIVAEVVDVPGEHSVRSGPKKEGLIEGRSSSQEDESGRGHELNLPKGTKLELELERALYLVKE